MSMNSIISAPTPEEFIRRETGKFTTGMPVEVESINAGYSNS
jgi:hypothetical protein